MGGSLAVVAPDPIEQHRRDLDRRRTLRLELRLKRLPRDVGVVLISVGAMGVMIPGPVPPGSLFLVVGAVYLSPRLFRPFGGHLLKRLPKIYLAFEGQVSRFHADLERRYPGSTRRSKPAKSLVR